MNLTDYKICVTPEGRDGLWLVSTNEIRRFAETWRQQHGETIHSTMPAGNMMIGADSSIGHILNLADQLDAETGPKDERSVGFAVTTIANIPGHDLVCATDRLEGFDIGEVTETDLEPVTA